MRSLNLVAIAGILTTITAVSTYGATSIRSTVTKSTTTRRRTRTSTPTAIASLPLSTATYSAPSLTSAPTMTKSPSGSDESCRLQYVACLAGFPFDGWLPHPKPTTTVTGSFMGGHEGCASCCDG